ncbi:MAG TPA: DUF6551 family protein [Vicinamibacterales bacterium]
MVDPKSILIDHQYQRGEKASLIDAIAQNPKWEVFGVIVCFSRKRDGKTAYYCVDGQQRLAGVARSPEPPQKVPVISFALEGVREEAEVFVRINEYRKSLSALEKHTGKIVAKDPAALTIEKVAESVGYTIGNHYNKFSDSRTIQAVASLNRVYNLIGEEGLEQTLVQIRDSWPDDRGAIESSMIVAIGNLIGELMSNDNGGGYSRPKLTKALGSVSPATIHRKAEALRFDMGGSVQKNMRRAIKALCKV